MAEFRAEKGQLQSLYGTPRIVADRSLSQRCVYTLRSSMIIISAALLVMLAPALSLSSPTPAGLGIADTAATIANYARQAAGGVLRDFQVYPPVLTPLSPNTDVLTNGSSQGAGTTTPRQGCVATETLVQYTFANSYGAPYHGPYTPPSNCAFNRATWNITVTSAGRQFDRLGIIYLGDTEIWRTSTAEPTANGIIWTYIKDVSEFLPLLKTPQTLIFDLGNIVDSTYTGPYHVTVTGTFFQGDDSVIPADAIVPISQRLGAENMASVFSVPSQNASNSITLPRNVNRAVVSLAATGQIDEEFWYTNVFSNDVDTFPQSGTLLGYSPFREVQLLIDGTLAGVVWPFPVIFTGGIVPGLWRPIVGIDAFDLREDEIDITPWLGILCDGKNHTFEIRVAGINDDGHGHGVITESVGSYWLVTGKIFLFLDPEGSVTTGPAPTLNAPPPTISLSSSITTFPNGTNNTLTYDTAVSRSFTVSSNIKSANGTSTQAWLQRLSYSNRGMLTNQGYTQVNVQQTTGYDASPIYARHISYPITVNSTYANLADGGLFLEATVERGQNIQVVGQPIFPTGLQSFAPFDGSEGSPRFQGSSLATTQNGSATYMSSSTSSSSTGNTTQDMLFEGLSFDGNRNYASSGAFPGATGSAELYHRYVSAVNASVVEDDETLVGRPIGSYRGAPGTMRGTDFAVAAPRGVLGRGRGASGPGGSR